MRYVDKDYSNRRIHLGLIARCKKGEKWGLIYGFRVPPYNGIEIIHENKLMYFEKDSIFEIEEKTLVSYLSYDYNGFIPEVAYVYPVDTIVKHNDRRGTYRADDAYHDDETWRLINNGIPYFDYSYGRQYCIYYPIVKENVCTMWRGLFGTGIYMNKEAQIYEITREIDNLNYSGWPSLENVSDKIAKTKEYINSINAYDIIDTYEIYQINIYHSKPGGDDSYSEHKYWKLQSDDGFLNFLLPTKDELIFFDDNAYRSDGYRDGHIILEEETAQAREKAKAEYTKEKHFAFLISDYFSEVLEKKERITFLHKKIDEEFDIANAIEVASHFNGKITDNFIALINRYNESTVIGPLETTTIK